MVVRIDYGKLRCDFYEGKHIGFFPNEGGIDIFIEGSKSSITVGVEQGFDVHIYLMNNQGKTIDKISI